MEINYKGRQRKDVKTESLPDETKDFATGFWQPIHSQL